jgi:dTDP-4-amino-4,6-dideoxygalactose transaminase
LYQVLREHGILVRRYFYPLISDFPMYRALPSAAPAWLPVARSVADQVLCLPIFPGLHSDQVDTIADLIAAQHRT